MFDVDKFKEELKRRRNHILSRIEECINKNTDISKRMGEDYEIRLDVLDSIIDTLVFMEDNKE